MSIVRRWGVRIGNYWRRFFSFFQKNKDDEEEYETIGVSPCLFRFID
jgi:hypothetical protein